MREFLKYLIKRILRFVLKVFWIFPIRNKVLFMSNMGKTYSCNPKYIYEYMQQQDIIVKIIWVFFNVDKYNYLSANKNTVIVNKKNLFRYFYHLLTSKVVVYNCGGFSYAPIRKKQLLIETWHGGGAYKKCGLTVESKSKFSKRGITLAMKDVKLFLSSSKLFEEKFIHDSMGYNGEILRCGLPRNDMLFNDNVNEIKERIGLNSNEHVLLYAPTFRGNEWEAESTSIQYEMLNTEKLRDTLQTKFGGKWIIACRGHQYSNKVNGNFDFDWSQYPDMQELLMVSDILISDYSSSIWDYSILKRPCFLYVPDLDYYTNKDRGFLTDIDNWHGIVSKSNDELIDNLLSYNQNEYENKLDKLKKIFMSYENGNACESVFNYIMEKGICK